MNLNKFSKYTFLIMMSLVYFTNPAHSQEQITVTGMVTDKNKLALIGVSVATNAGLGTQTNSEGKFTLKATDGELLTFSYLGYNTLKQAARPVMQVEMEENAVMLEAV